jgi:hypothetical protein
VRLWCATRLLAIPIWSAPAAGAGYELSATLHSRAAPTRAVCAGNSAPTLAVGGDRSLELEIYWADASLQAIARGAKYCACAPKLPKKSE